MKGHDQGQRKHRPIATLNAHLRLLPVPIRSFCSAHPTARALTSVPCRVRVASPPPAVLDPAEALLLRAMRRFGPAGSLVEQVLEAAAVACWALAQARCWPAPLAWMDRPLWLLLRRPVGACVGLTRNARAGGL